MSKNKEPLTFKEKFFAWSLLLNILAIGFSIGIDSPITDYVMYCLLIASGVSILCFQWPSLVLSFRSFRWPKVKCKLIKTKVTVESLVNRSGPSYRYTPYFDLEYEYKGKVYKRSSEQGFNFNYQKIFYEPAKAEKYLAKFKEKESRLKLFVNPENPEISYLRAGVNRDQIGICLFSLGLISLPALTAFNVISWHFN
ncbi:MAG: DUF3592 domain-containing protein [Neptuniibacter sp.]